MGVKKHDIPSGGFTYANKPMSYNDFKKALDAIREKDFKMNEGIVLDYVHFVRAQSYLFQRSYDFTDEQLYKYFDYLKSEGSRGYYMSIYRYFDIANF